MWKTTVFVWFLFSVGPSHSLCNIAYTLCSTGLPPLHNSHHTRFNNWFLVPHTWIGASPAWPPSNPRAAGSGPGQPLPPAASEHTVYASLTLLFKLISALSATTFRYRVTHCFPHAKKVLITNHLTSSRTPKLELQIHTKLFQNNISRIIYPELWIIYPVYISYVQNI